MFPGDVQHRFGDPLVQLRLINLQHRHIRPRHFAAADLFDIGFVKIRQILDIQPVPDERLLETRIVRDAHSFRQPSQTCQRVGGLFGRPDEDTLEPQQCLRHAPALVGLPDQRRGRHADVIEKRLGEFLIQIQGHQRPHSDAGRVHGHQKEPNPLLLFRLSVGASQHVNPVGVHRHGRPNFLPVDHVIVAVAFRHRAQRCQIGTGIRLAVALAPDVLARQDFRQEKIPLFLCPVRDQ